MNQPLQQKLGYLFQETNLLEQALTHASIRNEKSIDKDNQRMEYLGDAALGLACAEHLYVHFPSLPEGRLTVLRSNLTSTSTLAQIARSIDVGMHMTLGRGEEQSGGRNKSNNLADTLEAIIGAAYLDGGFPAVKIIFEKLFAPRLDQLDESTTITNPKGRLQEWAQQTGLPCPFYTVVSEEGPPHQRWFNVKVVIHDQLTAVGFGTTKRAAEADAATRLIKLTEAAT